METKDFQKVFSESYPLNTSNDDLFVQNFWKWELFSLLCHKMLTYVISSYFLSTVQFTYHPCLLLFINAHEQN